MSRKSASKVSDDAPVRAKDIGAGKLVLRKRATNGATPAAKQRVNIYLDAAVVEHFKAAAGARGYQTLINEALKDSIRSDTLEQTLRRVLQQELREYKN
ncbi:MAG: BrnA antitoxin family protein [Burkholderiales bacterium]|nr:BrnA antitoxin family protein [Burkholderiales bacterium]